MICLGLIDALELFAGLIIFADAQAEDKIRCKQHLFTHLACLVWSIIHRLLCCSYLRLIRLQSNPISVSHRSWIRNPMHSGEHCKDLCLWQRPSRDRDHGTSQIEFPRWNQNHVAISAQVGCHLRRSQTILHNVQDARPRDDHTQDTVDEWVCRLWETSFECESRAWLSFRCSSIRGKAGILADSKPESFELQSVAVYGTLANHRLPTWEQDNSQLYAQTEWPQS